MPEAQPPLRAGWASGMGASPPTGLRPAPPSVGVQRDTSVHMSYNSDLRKTPTGLVVTEDRVSRTVTGDPVCLLALVANFLLRIMYHT